MIKFQRSAPWHPLIVRDIAPPLPAPSGEVPLSDLERDAAKLLDLPMARLRVFLCANPDATAKQVVLDFFASMDSAGTHPS